MSDLDLLSGSIALPSRWKPMAPSDNSITVILNPSDQEYQKVEKSLKATAQNTLKSIIQVRDCRYNCVRLHVLMVSVTKYNKKVQETNNSFNLGASMETLWEYGC